MIISHDLGTTGDKATLVSDEGRVVAAVTATYGTDFGPRGKAEQDAGDWWNAVCRATRDLLAQASVAPADVEVVSFSGQMMGAVLLDGDGVPVRPAIIWADTRSVAQTATLVERVGMERGYRITGHRLNPTYSLSKVMWVRDHEPETFARAQKVVLAKDYVAFRLTGVLATDPSDASSTNAYDQAAGRWSDELLEAAALPLSLFPDVVASTAVVGRVTDEAATATGLAAGTPVVMGGGDGPMGALGAGILGPESGAYGYLGSSSWVSVAADAPLHDPQMRSMTFNHVLPGRYVPTATMQAGGASLEWVIDTLAPGQDDRYARLLADAADVQASEDGLYFLPHLLGERSPYWNPAARAVFAGLGRHHGPAHLTRAVLEGVAFNLYTGLLAFVENGTPIEAVDAIGGAANSRLLLQVFADVWGVPVTRRNLVDEATAVGAAIVGGVGVGIFDDFDVAGRFSEELTSQAPEPDRHARYAGEYALFMEAYQRLEPWFDKL
ncbi:xylulokinase [Microlunatus capsulatus]|uniref:Xylulose kinase n=1 Tax=Microlunatus capsulatus TaxID=99117 RepID=A0ABS4Z764_9ACTN|nr:xylulokinase [Microlunatus capsulatus]MBP2416891.1 xylulokinase [Microlunatus capsulatus]